MLCIPTEILCIIYDKVGEPNLFITCKDLYERNIIEEGMKFESIFHGGYINSISFNEFMERAYGKIRVYFTATIYNYELYLDKLNDKNYEFIVFEDNYLRYFIVGNWKIHGKIEIIEESNGISVILPVNPEKHLIMMKNVY